MSTSRAVLAGCVAALLLSTIATPRAQAQVCDADVCFPPPKPGEETETETGVTCTYTGDVSVMTQRTWTEGTKTYRMIDTNYYMWDSATGEAFIRSTRRCSDGSGGQYWRVITPDPQVLIQPAYDEVIGKLYNPVPSLSPTTRGIVNLGMWLAVEPPLENPATARAQMGAAWATATATLSRTTFDMGNGDDPVECDGFGDPIPPSAKDEVDPSPTCGFVYTNNEGQPYTITITSTWTFTYELSNGVTGTRPDVSLVSTVEYPVWEIQTVGESG